MWWCACHVLCFGDVFAIFRWCLGDVWVMLRLFFKQTKAVECTTQFFCYWKLESISFVFLVRGYKTNVFCNDIFRHWYIICMYTHIYIYAYMYSYIHIIRFIQHCSPKRACSMGLSVAHSRALQKPCKIMSFAEVSWT